MPSACECGGVVVSDLLPCPHCGNPPHEWIDNSPSSGGATINLDCCASMSEGYIKDEYSPYATDRKKAAKKRLYDRWNMRLSHGGES